MRAKRAKRSSTERAKVMVVDVRGEELGSVCDQLTQAGLKVVALTRPEAAIPLYRFFRPDAAVLATTGPQYSEVALGKQLRFVSSGALPLFYVVDKADSLSRTFVLKKGFGLDVIERPADPVELAAKITAHVRLKRAVERITLDQGYLRTPLLRDPITGLHNRAYFLEAMAAELRRCERYGGQFSVVLCRLEGFSRFQKAMGQEKTERVLTLAASTLKQALREADLVARVGEAEFAALLPKATEEALPIVLPRMGAGFAGERRLYFSLGSVTFPDVVGSPLQLLAAASSDLRRGKKAAAVGWTMGGFAEGAGFLPSSKGEERDV